MLALWRVIHQARFNKVLLCSNSTRAQTNCFFSVLLVIDDAVASNCRRNVIFSLKSSSKLCLFLSNYCSFDLIIHSKNINPALIEAYCTALNHISTAVQFNSALFLESNVNSAA